MRTRLATIAATLLALTLALPLRAANYTDWWWGGAGLDGEGVNVGQQAGTVFVSWFTYDEQGNGMWVVFSGQFDSTGKVVSGAVYRTTGPALGATYDPAKVNRTPVGDATLTFLDMHRATFAWNVNGKSGSLPLVRQTYGASVIAGNFEGYTSGNLQCPGTGPYPMPTDTPVYAKGSMSISTAYGGTTGVYQFGTTACTWTGTAAQSGQLVHIAGNTTCPGTIGAGSIDLTLFVLDHAVVGWQKSSSAANGCVQTEQFSLIRSE